MRTIKPLDALLPRLRQRLLAPLVLQPDRKWYLSDLARHLKVRPSTLQRELAALTRGGILRRSRDGNRVYFEAESSSPLLPELRGLLVKTVGLVDVLRSALRPLAPRIRCAFVHGSIARGEEHAASDVDLLIVGDVGLAEVAPTLDEAQQALGRPVNPTVYRPDEFARKARAGHHFLTTVLASPKLFLLGRDADLVQPPGNSPRAAASDKRRGTAKPAGRRRTRPA